MDHNHSPNHRDNRGRGYSSFRRSSSGHVGPRRPSGGFHRPHPKRFSQSGGGRGRMAYIDPAKLVVKAKVTEEITHYEPTHAFNDFAIDARLKHTIAAKGYVTPTPIQDKAIPYVLLGKDVVGIANTGTGKTAAFLVPLIHRTLKDPGAQTLILVPTRELALQIEEEFRIFAKGLSLYAVTLIGGVNIHGQLQALRRRNHFVIGTPGRVQDMIKRRVLNLSGFHAIVLDEADRMLDMGFIDSMRSVISAFPPVHQTLFFSATLSPDIEKLIHEFLNEPVRISVKVQDTSVNVDQDIIRIKDQKEKLDLLHDLLTQPGFNKVLVFGRTKHGVEKLSKMLIQRGFKAESIHGNKTHGKRQQALSLFKGNRIQILVATDVAARGLDIDDISHVINYDMPATYEDYVHRIGRTGRVGKKGKAITFVER